MLIATLLLQLKYHLRFKSHTHSVCYQVGTPTPASKAHTIYKYDTLFSVFTSNICRRNYPKTCLRLTISKWINCSFPAQIITPASAHYKLANHQIAHLIGISSGLSSRSVLHVNNSAGCASLRLRWLSHYTVLWTWISSHCASVGDLRLACNQLIRKSCWSTCS